jgi:hypothetical protein
MEAEGDGSAFAAVRGFDFDVTSDASRPTFEGLPEPELRFAAIDRLIRHPAVQDVVDGEQRPPRESVVAFPERLKAGGAEAARQVHCFQQRLPRPVEQGQGAVRGGERTITAPDEIAAFGQDEHCRCLTAGASDSRCSHSPAGRASKRCRSLDAISVVRIALTMHRWSCRATGDLSDCLSKTPNGGCEP